MLFRSWDERVSAGRLAIVEAIKAGTTTLGDYHYEMETTCQFIHKTGARGNITQMIRAAKQKVYKPGELYEFDDENLVRHILGSSSLLLLMI